MAGKRLKDTMASESFRFIEENHQFVVTNNETGDRKKVLSTGEGIPYYDLQISGMVNKKVREKIKDEKPS